MPAPAVSAPPLQVRRGQDVLVLSGELDEATAPLLREALETGRPDPQPEQVLDLRRVNYLDSVALAVLYDHAHRLRLLVSNGSPVATVVAISGLIHAAADVQFHPAP
ncbi:MAG: STAS domain-containing protein [Sporichthyaceae bacterium]